MHSRWGSACCLQRVWPPSVVVLLIDAHSSGGKYPSIKGHRPAARERNPAFACAICGSVCLERCVPAPAALRAMSVIASNWQCFAGRLDRTPGSSLHARWSAFLTSDEYVWLLAEHRLLAEHLAPPPREPFPPWVAPLLAELRWGAFAPAQQVFNGTTRQHELYFAHVHLNSIDALLYCQGYLRLAGFALRNCEQG